MEELHHYQAGATTLKDGIDNAKTVADTLSTGAAKVDAGVEQLTESINNYSE